MKPAFAFALLFVCACSSTLYADHYASDCDADNQCVRVSVGDQCACTCELVAISERDYDQYISDLERIGGCRNTCGASADGAAYTCGEGIGARCTKNMCATYTVVVPGDGGADGAAD